MRSFLGMRILFASVVVLLFGAADAQAENLTVKITKTDNNTSTVTGAASLEAAIGFTPLGEVQMLEISAGNFTSDDWEWLSNNRSALASLTHFSITSSTASVADIPPSLGGLTIFGNKIKELSVAKVKRIGEVAFQSCTALTTASFPDATSIGNDAFNGCTALTTASFPKVESIGVSAFLFCDALTTINFPLVTSIGEWAFKECDALTAASFPKATSIGSYAFYFCEALSTTTFPMVTSIGEAAFKSCTALTNLKLGAAPPSVGADAFNKCPAHRYLTPVGADGTPLTGTPLTSAFQAYRAINDGNTDDNLWYGWVAAPIYSIAIGTTTHGSVSCSRPWAPAGATLELTVTPESGYMLQSLSYTKQSGGGAVPIDMTTRTFTMPDASVTVDATFATNVLRVTVNDGPTPEIGSSLGNALAGLDLGSITSLTITEGSFFAADWLWLKANRGNLSNLKHFTITDGIGHVDDIPGTTPGAPYFHWRLESLNVARVANIGSCAFYSRIYLKTVNMPHATRIDEKVFQGCSSLTTANFPRVMHIRSEAFRLCTALTAACFPQVTEIQEYAFMDCAALVDLALGITPPRSDKIGFNAFKNCPPDRHLTPVNADGTPLTGTDLTAVINAYKAIDDGDPTDNLWYDWKLGQTHPIEINTTGNGRVGSSRRFAPVNAKVKLTIDPQAGHLLQAGSLKAHKTGEASTAVDITNNELTMPAYGVTVEAAFVQGLQLTANGSSGKIGLSLQDALKGENLGNITSLTATGGPFTAADWLWLKANRTSLSALTHFTITSGTGSVADIPDTDSDNSYFGSQLRELSLAKVDKIGSHAFHGCSALTYLMLHATTPPAVGADAFRNCPATRFLIPVDADGTPLTGQPLTNALKAYKAVNDGALHDNLWYGWIAEPTHPITIGAIKNGTVGSSYPRATAGTTVGLTLTPVEGCVFSSSKCNTERINEKPIFGASPENGSEKLKCLSLCYEKK